MAEPKLFDDSPGDELLIAVYEKQGRTLDDLPYTPQFEAIAAAMDDGDDTAGAGPASEASADEQADEAPVSHVASNRRAALFHRLHNLRKAGKLPRLGRAAEKPPTIEADHEQLLVTLVEQAIGKLSLRDRLPYHEAFDQIVESFNAQAGLSLSHHAVWRIIAKLAK